VQSDSISAIKTETKVFVPDSLNRGSTINFLLSTQYVVDSDNGLLPDAPVISSLLQADAFVSLILHLLKDINNAPSKNLKSTTDGCLSQPHGNFIPPRISPGCPHRVRRF
jgi:hypothetical protein